MQIQYYDIKAVTPYKKNPRKNDAAVDAVAASIREFGFKVPIVLDADGVIIAGHTRLKAAEKLGMTEVPCVVAHDLTDEQVKAFRLADNKVGELAEWDFGLLVDELSEIGELDMSDFGFSVPEVNEWFDRANKEGAEREEGNDEYNEFLEKFEQPKTTDDCYTPQNIYDVVADWVAEEYNLDKARFCRPFYPGGDYQSEDYSGKIVVDNPPFSILAEIQEFYREKSIPFFLFAPNVTCLTKHRRSTAICVGAGITYENKAKVLTSFVTNLEDGIVARTAPDLYERIKVVDDENTKGNSLPKFEYPPQLVTAAMLSKLSKYGQDFRLKDADCSEKISALESQRETGDAIFGGGFLISEKAAAEKAAAEKAAAEKAAAKVWKLSEKELEIIKGLG